MFTINFEPREYQKNISQTCLKDNCLVVLPTGLGKTKTAILTLIERLNSHPQSKALFLTVTKPLAAQIQKEIQNSTDIPKDSITLFTGEVKPETRKSLWNSSKVIISTPQCIENDVLNKNFNINDVSILIIDEAHHTTKKYSYNWIAKHYGEHAEYPRIIGLTASPGSDAQTIKQVCKNLQAVEIEIRSHEDIDVKDYVQETEVEWVMVDLPEKFKEIRSHLEHALNQRFSELKHWGLVGPSQETIGKKQLIMLQLSIQHKLSEGQKDVRLWQGISKTAEALKIHHAVELLETQGISQLIKYLKSLYDSASNTKVKAVKSIVNDSDIKIAFEKAKRLNEIKDLKEPKLIALKDIMEKRFKKDERAIIFTQYRDSGAKIEALIKQIEGINPTVFVGQAKKDGVGMSQKQQAQIIKDFESGKNNVMIATSVHPEEYIILKKGDEIKIKKIGEFVESFIQKKDNTPYSKGISGWEALSSNGKNVFFKPITHVHRHIAKDNLSNIKLKSGFECSITRDHSLFSFNSKSNFFPEKPALNRFIAMSLKCPNIEQSKKIDIIKEVYKNVPKGELNQLFGAIHGLNQAKMRMLKTDFIILSKIKKDGLSISQLSRITQRDYSTVMDCLRRLSNKSLIEQKRIKRNYKKVSQSNEKGLRYLNFLGWFFNKVEYKKGKYRFNLLGSDKNLESFNLFFNQSLNVRYGKMICPRFINLNKYVARFLGFYVSEGSSRKTKYTSNVFLSAKVKKMQELMKESIEKGLKFKTRTNWKGIAIDSQISYYLIKDVFRAGIGAYNKEVPEIIFTSPKKIKWEFLEAYFLGDGHISKNKERIVLTTVSRKLVIGLVLLLRMLGVKKISIGRQKHIYRVNVYESLPFAKLKEKSEKVNKTYYSLIPEALKSKKVFDKYQNSYFPRKVRQKGVWENDICFDYIQKIERVKKSAFVYDLSVKDTENFIGGTGLFCLHNSVAEQGLDIPEVNLVIFHEPIPSAIRTIQRKGRTGRHSSGEIIILITKGTRDEAYHWAAFNKEKRMYRELEKMKDSIKLDNQTRLNTVTIEEEKAIPHSITPSQQSTTTSNTSKPPMPKLWAIADQRERSSKITKHLIELGIDVKTEQLEVADYILSENVAVELKTKQDFVNSIIDGRLLSQLRNMRNSFTIPLLILEGDEDIYSIRNIHPNAIRGMISTIAIDYNIPIIQTKNNRDTAELFKTIIDREQNKQFKDFPLRPEKKPFTLREQQQFIIESLPGIGPTSAKSLLKEFKSIKNIINADEKQLQNAPLVGPKKASEIKKVTDGEYKEKN